MPSRIAPFAVVVALALALAPFALACGGSVSSDTAGSETGGETTHAGSDTPSPGTPTPTPAPGSPTPGTPTPGAPGSEPAAIDDTVVAVRLQRLDLGGAPGCHEELRAVVYDRKTREMTWPACTSADLPAWWDAGAWDSGAPLPEIKRVLTDGEAKRVEDAFATMTYAEHPKCELYDGREWVMKTTSGAGVVVDYSATNVNCPGYRVVSNLPAVYELFVSLRG